MDLTFAVQALAAHHLASHAADLEPGIQPIPETIDDLVARAKLAALGVEPEILTEEQISYQQSWR
jgi:adenosylhomocysteinase